MPVISNPVPSTPVNEPLPAADPPAPLPTKDNNPIRPKVKAGLNAGLITTAVIAMLAIFGVDLPADSSEQIAVGVSGLLTVITFVVAYLKRDGLSPK